MLRSFVKELFRTPKNFRFKIWKIIDFTLLKSKSSNLLVQLLCAIIVFATTNRKQFRMFIRTSQNSQKFFVSRTYKIIESTPLKKKSPKPLIQSLCTIIVFALELIEKPQNAPSVSPKLLKIFHLRNLENYWFSTAQKKISWTVGLIASRHNSFH